MLSHVTAICWVTIAGNDGWWEMLGQNVGLDYHPGKHLPFFKFHDFTSSRSPSTWKINSDLLKSKTKQTKKKKKKHPQTMDAKQIKRNQAKSTTNSANISWNQKFLLETNRFSHQDLPSGCRTGQLVGSAGCVNRLRPSPFSASMTDLGPNGSKNGGVANGDNLHGYNFRSVFEKTWKTFWFDFGGLDLNVFISGFGLLLEEILSILNKR